jgi:CheY-like chemotaxis protein
LDKPKPKRGVILGQELILDEPIEDAITILKQWTDSASIFASNPSHSTGSEGNRTSAGNLFQRKIMIVDDETAIAKLYSLILSNAGFTVSHLESNGLDAVAKIKNSEDIDLVIIDQRMPKMDGLTATKKMKHVNPDLKVIMVTAYEIPNPEKKAFNAVLTKPVSSRVLVDTVSSVLRKS